MSAKKYTFIEHTADIKFKINAKTLPSIFNNCALAISEILTRNQRVKPAITQKIRLTGTDLHSLLYQFIDELIYFFDAKQYIVAKTHVIIKDNTLEGTIFCDHARNYNDLDHIKAATYADMYIKQKRTGNWEAQVVVDV